MISQGLGVHVNAWIGVAAWKRGGMLVALLARDNRAGRARAPRARSRGAAHSRLIGIALGAAASVLACSSTSVAPISVRYRGPADYRPVSTSSVEVIREGEQRPCVPIADLEVASDGSTYEALVERLRQRAASLGADAICDVRSVYDVGAGHFSSDARTTPVRPEDQLMDAAKAGFSVFMNRPTWVSVRGTAVRLKDLHPEDQRPMGGAPESRPGQSDARESMPSETPASRPAQPQEKPPAEKP